ncbi:uncharacterized protein LOC142952880 [Anarhichas minor]|uniref:uncharacterized protein LOC142952880 n=1 Tax=Anarhichas minor TaxID=65739 RepID=UPI003F734001
MDPRWMILPVVLMCAEVLVEVAVGQNATLTCSVDTTDVHWSIEISSQVKVHLARSYSSDPEESEYCVNTSFKHKYMAMGNTLVISNITAEDNGRYFCGRKNNNNVIFTDTFRLVTAVPLTSFTNNSEENQQQHICRIVHSELIVYSSFALNVLLFFVIIGLVLTSPCLNRKSCKHQVNDPSPFTSENPEMLETPQYEEIQFRAPSPAAPHLTECVYHKAQLPGAPLPRHH